MVIKRISPLSAGKVAGLLYALLGLLFGGLISLFSLLAGGLAAGMSDSDAGAAGAFVGMFFGVGAIIILPIFYGLCGFIGMAISAALYNLAAGFVGGIEIETQ